MSKVFSGLIWKFFERFGTVGIQFIIQIILARLLSPDDYGAIALITVFITVSYIFHTLQARSIEARLCL